MNDINEQIDAFAMHLIEREAEVCPRGNKRSNSEHEKFVLSTCNGRSCNREYFSKKRF